MMAKTVLKASTTHPIWDPFWSLLGYPLLKDLSINPRSRS